MRGDLGKGLGGLAVLYLLLALSISRVATVLHLKEPACPTRSISCL